MKTRLLLFIGLTLVSGTLGTVYGVPALDSEHAFRFSEIVVIGQIMSVDILSEPSSSISGIAMYDIKVEESLKNPDNIETISVPGLFLRDPHPMAYETYPYEVGQKVLLYFQENTHDIAGTDLIIRLGDSKVIDEDSHIAGKHGHLIELTDLIPEPDQERPIPQKCGEGTILQNGICQLIDNGCEPDMYGNIYCDPMIEDSLTLERFLNVQTENPNECWYQKDDGTIHPCIIENAGIDMAINMGLVIFWPYIILGIAVVMVVIIWRRKK